MGGGFCERRKYIEQYSHEPNIATPRFWITHNVEIAKERRLSLETKRELGYAALGVMEGHLRERKFLVGNRYSIADIALYAYTHVADEGGFDLGRFPAIAAWIERVRNQPGHVPDNAGLSGGGHEPEDAHGLRTLRGRPRRRRASFHLQLRVHLLRELRNQYGTRLFELLRGAGAPAQTPIRGNVGA